ncbi:MAG: NAD(P)-dependent oxidoreductase, partial [Casimicrobium sp.]
IDAPVAGSRPQADAGQLIFMVGGETQAVDAARDVFSAMGGALHHVGPTGSGALLKLAVNALFGVQVATVAELLNFLSKNGADAPRALEALRAMPVMSPAAAGAGGLILAQNFAPQAPVDLIAKDLGYAVQSARNCDAVLPATEVAWRTYKRASDAGFGNENLVAVSKLFA